MSLCLSARGAARQAERDRGQPIEGPMAETIALRDTVAAQMKAAMKAGDKVRTGALRLMMAALKEREIEARGAGKIVSRADEMALLTKMVKQRQESLAIYEQAGREDLAAQERAEIAVIGEFLPKQMDEAEVTAAAKAAIAAAGAASLKDMGKVVAALKENYPGQMDFAKASAIVKALLTS
jgi:hypothetical protein